MLLAILIINYYLEILLTSPGTAGSWSAMWFPENNNRDILMYEGMTKRTGSVFLMASKWGVLPHSVIHKSTWM